MAIAAKANLLAFGNVHPVAILLLGDKIGAIPLRFSDDLEKQRLREKIRRVVSQKNPEAVCFIAEAYTLGFEEYRRTGLRPMHHPEREEAIMIACAMPGFKTAVRIPFSSTLEDKMVFGEEAEQVGGDGGTFWTENLFPEQGKHAKTLSGEPA